MTIGNDTPKVQKMRHSCASKNGEALKEVNPAKKTGFRTKHGMLQIA